MKQYFIAWNDDNTIRYLYKGIVTSDDKLDDDLLGKKELRFEWKNAPHNEGCGSRDEANNMYTMIMKLFPKRNMQVVSKEVEGIPERTNGWTLAT